jgi:hypothetical protein
VTRKQSSRLPPAGIEDRKGTNWEVHSHFAMPRVQPVRKESFQRKKSLELGRDQLGHDDTIELLDQAVSDNRLVKDLSVCKRQHIILFA